MGWELIVAMVAAAAVTRGWEHSKRRSAAAWQQARDDARRRAERKQRETEQRRQATRRWFEAARRDPRHPVAWGYGLGWGLAAAAAASVAGVQGARAGAATGAREGVRLGRTAARDGWTWRSTWREWRAQRAADDAQHARADRNIGGRCVDCGEVEAVRLVRTRDDDLLCVACLAARAYQRWRRRCGDEEPAGQACRSCGTRDPHRVVILDDDTAECVTCLRRRRDEEEQRARVGEQDPPPVMVRCLGCGVVITGARAAAAGGLCGDCTATPDERPAADGTDKADDAGQGRGDRGNGDVHDAEVVAPAAIAPPRPCGRCDRSSADGPIYPHCQDGTGRHHDEEEPTTMSSSEIQRSDPLQPSGAGVGTDLVSGHEGGEMGIEDTRTIYRQIAANCQTMAELIDRLATSLTQFKASGEDLRDAQQVMEQAGVLAKAAEDARTRHDRRNAMTEQAAVEEADAVRHTDYHRLGK